ncbi:MAG: PIN domain-containing protein [Bifidobacteriaceae bacterium]|jgi:predicted nucleic acid-binding protein|nr:PIN domain-containing protein [Bifidobacteriaceae bacterium]
MQVVVYDANVLYPSVLRDVLIRVGLAGLVQPKWTERILDEMFRNLAANRPDLGETRLARTRLLMNAALRGVVVTGYDHWIDQITLPDPADRHVLAAAIEAGADLIVTKNLKDFPIETLDAFGIGVSHPDPFLENLCVSHPAVLAGIASNIAVDWKSPEASPQAVVDALARDAPRASALNSSCTVGGDR